MIDKYFRTLPTVLPLTVGGGSRIKNKKGAYMNGSDVRTHIHSLDWILDPPPPPPPDHSSFNVGGGRSRMWLNSAHISTTQEWAH
jgi:hypothetical protein